jgi:hypothetical protein
MRAGCHLLLWLGCITAAAGAAAQELIPDDIDPAAEIAAASEIVEPPPFKRLWTSEERFRLYDGLTISADGSRVMACTYSGGFTVIDAATGEEILRFTEKLPGQILSTALSGDGSRAALGLRNGGILVIDTLSGKVVARHEAMSPVNRVFISRDGVHLVWFAGQFYRAPLTGGKAQGFGGAQAADMGNRNASWSFSPDGKSILVTDGIPLPTMALLEFGSERPEAYRPESRGDMMCSCQSDGLIAYYTGQGDIVFQTHPASGAKEIVESRPSRLPVDPRGWRGMGVSMDGAAIVGIGRGVVEIFWLDALGTPAIHPAECELAVQAEVAQQRLRFAIIDQKGYLAVLEMGETYQNPGRRFTLVLRTLAKGRRYAALDEFAELLKDDPVPFPWEPSRTKYDAFDTLAIHEGPEELSGLERINAWLEASPRSQCARTLEIGAIVERGWKARGTGFAGTVSPEGWRVFHTSLEEANEKALKLFEEEHPPAHAYQWLFEIAKGQSWPEEEWEPFQKRLMKQSPAYLPPHQTMIEKLLVRWGGRPTSAERYAREVADAIGGGDGDVAYAELALRVAWYETGDMVVKELGFDYDRVQRGWQHMQNQPGGRTRGLMGELFMAQRTGETGRAGKLLRRIEQEKHPYHPGLFQFKPLYEQLYEKHRDAPEDAVMEPSVVAILSR